MSVTSRNCIETSISTLPAPRIAFVKASALTVMKSITSAWKFWNDRRAMARLVTLEDHMLKDMGITRGDVQLVASLPYSDDPTGRLHCLAVERRASVRARAREMQLRRTERARQMVGSGSEQYRSTDRRNADHCRSDCSTAL